MITTETIVVAVARVLIGSLFVGAGIRHRKHVAIMAGMLERRHIPLSRIAVVGAIATQVIAGTALMLGLFVPWAAGVLVAFTLCATLLFVDFWNQKGPERARTLMTFQLNLACVGGLLLLALNGLRPG